MLSEKLTRVFKEKFDKTPELIIKAPGRINIIGEHTDYNLGYVLPAAINHHMYLGVAKNASREINIYSIDYDQQASFPVHEVLPSEVDWLNLIKGVIHQLKDDIHGFDLAFTGNVPVGAGLSSSAALCCGTVYALTNLFDLNLQKWDIAKIAQNSEHTFAGVPCGIMDQFACMFGQEDHVLLLDCLTLDYDPIKIDMSGHQLILLDSQVKHQLNDSEYNSRSHESAEALSRLKAANPKIKNFRDITLQQLDHYKSDEIEHDKKDTQRQKYYYARFHVAIENKFHSHEIWWKRAYHIVSENERVLKIGEALKTGQMEMVGRLLNEGHQSQKNHFEITCAETDFLADALNQEAIVLGARQVGGGFGGCILALVKDQGVNEMIERIQHQYADKYGRSTRNIPIKISQGCHLV